MTHEDFGGVSLARALQVHHVYKVFGRGMFKPNELKTMFAIPVSTGMQSGYYEGLPKERSEEPVYRLSTRGYALAKLVEEQTA